MNFKKSIFYSNIPPETAFELGTQHKEKGDKQKEIDMPNTNLNSNVSQSDHTPPLARKYCGLWDSLWVHGLP